MFFREELRNKAKTLLAQCRAQKTSLAVAESCTGGLLSALLTDISGASDVFLGGIISYSNAVKIDILGVKSETIIHYGAVSEQAAQEMAQGVARILNANLSASVTGIAGPDGGSTEKPLGTVHIATQYRDEIHYTHFQFNGNREEIRLQAVEAAVNMLLLSTSSRRR